MPLTELKNAGNTNSLGTSGLFKDDQVQYNFYVTKSKELVSQGKLQQAVELVQKAYKINPNDKLFKRINKMKDHLKLYDDEDDEEEDEDDNMAHVGEGFYLYNDLYSKLYPHQREGILWMWKLHQQKKGGILGDDMGLGKTIQCISFLSGLFDDNKVKTILIVMPVSLILNWEREFDKWAPGIKLVAYHGTSKRERERELYSVQRKGGVLLTSYGMVVSSWEQLGSKDGRDFVWDYVMLDEGHKIKNPTKTSKGVRAIQAGHRILLTGTPIQNNLKELWALFDYVHQGGLLGTAKTFKMEFETPITRAREKDATMGEKRLGSEMSETLKRIISPYFLRRTKAEVQKIKQELIEKVENQPSGSLSPQMPSLTRKNDLIIWSYLSGTQQKIYTDFLHLEEVKDLLMTSKSPLTALIVLKKICDHPRLLSTGACNQLGLAGNEIEDDDDPSRYNDSAVTRIKEVPDDVLITEAGKMVFLVELLDNLKSEGHRCLIFSQSRKVLDIIQKVITNRGHKVMRLDGTVHHLSEREARIDKFQSDMSYSVFLLTTQVGGVGLTLTSADRVVIFDPSWNPATDAQAVDRVFRIGQDKNVVIYRLVTCGTVEEKIYRRQIFKDSITRQATGNTKNPYRYFTKGELRELFTLDDPRHSTTQEQLQTMHSSQRKSDTTLDSHIAYLHSLDIFGITDHDLMFSQEDENIEENESENDYIQARAEKAAKIISIESEMSDKVTLNPQELREELERKPAKINIPDRPKVKQETKYVPTVQEAVIILSDEDTRTESSTIVIEDDDDQIIDLAKVDVGEDGEDEDLNNTVADLTLDDPDIGSDSDSDDNEVDDPDIGSGSGSDSDSDDNEVDDPDIGSDSDDNEDNDDVNVKRKNKPVIESDEEDDDNQPSMSVGVYSPVKRHKSNDEGYTPLHAPDHEGNQQNMSVDEDKPTDKYTKNDNQTSQDEIKKTKGPIESDREEDLLMTSDDDEKEDLPLDNSEDNEKPDEESIVEQETHVPETPTMTQDHAIDILTDPRNTVLAIKQEELEESKRLLLSRANIINQTLFGGPSPGMTPSIKVKQKPFLGVCNAEMVVISDDDEENGSHDPSLQLQGNNPLSFDEFDSYLHKVGRLESVGVINDSESFIDDDLVDESYKEEDLHDKADHELDDEPDENSYNQSEVYDTAAEETIDSEASEPDNSGSNDESDVSKDKSSDMTEDEQSGEDYFSEASFSDDETRIHFEELVQKGKDLLAQNKRNTALKTLLKALQIYPDPDLSEQCKDIAVSLGVKI